jgi:leucyl/phenylalanyl-tRNA---protein transferase
LPLFALDERIWFPPVEESMEDGLLAFGADLSVERLLLAYKEGIFPWYDGEIPLWWSPDPRCVLFPGDLKISHSMKQLLKQKTFRFSVDADFREVMMNCRQAKRKGDPGTWITDEIVEAYCTLHEMGHAHCAAVYKNGEMVGGLYGLMVNKVFCGESMFSKVSNASKYTFIKYVQHLAANGIELVDCQVHNPHLESLGATMIPRKEFLKYLKANN